MSKFLDFIRYSSNKEKEHTYSQVQRIVHLEQQVIVLESIVLDLEREKLERINARNVL